MSADADFAKVVAALRDPRPAYVAFTERIHGHAFVDFDHSAHLVARSADGAIVHGQPIVENESGTVNHHPFDPHCYAGRSERREHRDGRDVLAIALAPSNAQGCGRDADFKMLYADPLTLHPIAVEGHNTDDKASAHLAETFADVDGHAVMTGFSVDVDGSGPMFWLQIHVTDDYTNYRFSAADPGK